MKKEIKIPDGEFCLHGWAEGELSCIQWNTECPMMRQDMKDGGCQVPSFKGYYLKGTSEWDEGYQKYEVKMEKHPDCPRKNGRLILTDEEAEK